MSLYLPITWSKFQINLANLKKLDFSLRDIGFRRFRAQKVKRPPVYNDHFLLHRGVVV